MTIKLSDNIRALRKGRRLTQEQLAEALGVTVGAVSKWESGATTPDISLIVALADFFETSVDALLGYDWRAGSMGQTLDRIKKLRNEKLFDEACAEAEKALLKYPNSFETVYQSALLYTLKGVERRCRKSYTRALALLERSLELISQNTDAHINRWTIQNHIAKIYLEMGKTGEALELMKKNNAAGLNDIDIGYTLTTAENKPDEALRYLSDGLVDCVDKLLRLSCGYANAYEKKRDYVSELAVLRWTLDIVNGLRRPGLPSYHEKMAAQLLTACAVAAALGGDLDAARDYLRRAIAQADSFDASPCYGFAGTRFFHSDQRVTAFDDFGDTALSGVERAIKENREIAPAVWDMWLELRDERKEKA